MRYSVLVLLVTRMVYCETAWSMATPPGISVCRSECYPDVGLPYAGRDSLLLPADGTSVLEQLLPGRAVSTSADILLVMQSLGFSNGNECLNTLYNGLAGNASNAPTFLQPQFSGACIDAAVASGRVASEVLKNEILDRFLESAANDTVQSALCSRSAADDVEVAGSGNETCWNPTISDVNNTLTIGSASLYDSHTSWLDINCSSVVANRMVTAETSLDTLDTLAQCYLHAARIFNATFHLAHIGCALSYDSAAAFGENFCHGTSSITTDENMTRHKTDRVIFDCWHSLRLQSLPVMVRQALQLSKLARFLKVLRSAVTSLHAVRRSLESILQPEYPFSWPIGKDVSVVLCSSVFNTMQNSSDKQKHLNVCCGDCHNTKQLLSGLKSVVPSVFATTSLLSGILSLFQVVFTELCQAPCMWADGNASSATRLCRDATICLAAQSTNRSNVSLQLAAVFSNHSSYNSELVRLNITCQYPFVHSGKRRAAELQSLTSDMVRLSCVALNLSQCPLPDALLYCDMLCEPVTYSKQVTALYASRYVLFVFSLVAFASNTVAIVAYILNRHRIQAPARRVIVLMNCAMLLYLLDYLLLPFEHAARAVNGYCSSGNTVSRGEPRGDASLCGFDSFRNAFASVALTTLAPCACHAWHILVVKLTGRRYSGPGGASNTDRNQTIVYAIIALVAATLSATIIVATQSAQGRPDFRWCESHGITKFYVFALPFIICIIVGLALILKGIPRLICLSKKFKASSFNRHLKRSAVVSGSSASHSSNKGIERLIKLLALYLILFSIQGVIVIITSTQQFVSASVSSDADLYGLVAHSRCLMTAKQAVHCDRIKQQALWLAVTLNVYLIFMAFVFSLWSYRWVYWRRHWPFSKIEAYRKRQKAVGVKAGMVACLAFLDIEPQSSAAQIRSTSSDSVIDDSEGTLRQQARRKKRLQSGTLLFYDRIVSLGFRYLWCR